MSNIINMITDGSKGLTPTIRAYAPEGSTLTCDGKSYTLKEGETYHDFSVSCEKASVLPTGYTGLEYIESSGAQYINTGLVFTNATYERFIFDAQITNYSSENVLFGALTSSSGARPITFISQTSGAMYFQIGSSNTALNATIGTTKHSYDVTASNGTSSFTFDGTTTTGTYSGNLYNTLPLALFSHNYNGFKQYIYAKLWRFIIYTSEDNLAMNLVPCTNASSVVGMYDTVGKAFYPSATSTAFIASTNTKEWLDYPTYTVTAILDGKTYTKTVTVDKTALFDCKFKVVAHPEIVWDGTGTWVTISNRTYNKTNSGDALCGASIITASGTVYTAPVLVSKDSNAVTYFTNGSTFTYATTVSYYGDTWYISSTDNAMSGAVTCTFSDSDFIEVDVRDESDYASAGGVALLKYYYGEDE